MREKKNADPLNYNIMDSQFQIRQNPLAVDDNWDLNTHTCSAKRASARSVPLLFCDTQLFHMCFAI